MDESILDEGSIEETISFFQQQWSNISGFIPKIITSLLIIVVGYFLTKIIVSIVKKALNKTRLNPSMHGFIKSCVRVLLYTVFLLIVMSIWGINATSIVTLISALGLAISLAVKDTLSNFAEGIIILASHPFQVGDFIHAADVKGTVLEINVLYTIMTTRDNKKIHVPNGKLSNAIITNYSSMETRRLDVLITVGKDDDDDHAIEVIRRTLKRDENILDEPSPLVKVQSFATGCAEICIHVWVHNKDYWDSYYDLVDRLKNTFDEENLTLTTLKMES